MACLSTVIIFISHRRRFASSMLLSALFSGTCCPCLYGQHVLAKPFSPIVSGLSSTNWIEAGLLPLRLAFCDGHAVEVLWNYLRSHNQPYPDISDRNPSHPTSLL
ncbi:hypothetical protein Ancab_029376 [Ancistrocladus abbreviatus]